MNRTGQLLVAAALLGLAALQLNDPDPLFWVTMYAVAALPPLAVLAGRYSAALFWVATGFCLAGFTTGLPGLTDYISHTGEVSLAGPMNDEQPFIEESREALGSLIALLLLWAHHGMNRRQGDA